MTVHLCRKSNTQLEGMTQCDCEPGACAMLPTVPHAQRVELRALRRWHYAAMVKARALGQQAASGVQALTYNALADTHLRFVQTLNGFFMADDTADRE